METTAKIIKVLEGLNESELLSAWNEYQRETSGGEEILDFDDDFFETYFPSPADAARAVFFGDVRSWNDDYVVFSGYGNLETTSNLEDHIDMEELAEYIEEHPRDFKSIMDEVNNLEDEEEY